MSAAADARRRCAVCAEWCGTDAVVEREHAHEKGFPFCGPSVNGCAERWTVTR